MKSVFEEKYTMKLWESEFALVGAESAEAAAAFYMKETEEVSTADEWTEVPTNKRITLYDEDRGKRLSFWPKSLVGVTPELVGLKDI